MTPTLILASGSPRRRELLAILGLPFTIAVADINESALPAEAPEPHARRLAETKARVVAQRSNQENGGVVVLAADTIVVQHGQIIGKPIDDADARRMLAALRDSPHQVITAVAMASAQTAVLVDSHTSDVVMRPYSDADIDDYVASGDPLDKAGAYAIQNSGFRPVAHFEGCFASIMGLPVALVADLLRQAGLSPAPDWPLTCQALTGQCCAKENSVFPGEQTTGAQKSQVVLHQTVRTDAKNRVSR